MLVFERPGYLAILILIVPAIYFSHFYPKRGGLIPMPIQGSNREWFYAQLIGPRLLGVCASLTLWLATVSIILALAGPARITRERVYLTSGIDIMIILDESPSMAAQDFAPRNRFESARAVIRAFVAGRGNDSIGLISFGSEAVLRTPLTLDYDYLLARLNELEIVSLGDGTAIGLGMALGVLHLRAGGGSRKLIILLTDGRNNSGEILPEQVAHIAAQSGIHIYAIGIGRAEGTPLEFEDPRTGQLFRGSIEQGFDEELLNRIADLSGGSYFYAGSSSTLDSVFQAIESLETVDRRARARIAIEPIDGRYIVVAFCCLFIYFIIRKPLLRNTL